MAYDVMLIGTPTAPHRARSTMVGMKQSLLERAADVYLAGAVRHAARDEPDVR